MQSYNMTSQDLEISTKSGCNYLATKRISKTASINSISKRQRANWFIVWCFIVIMAVPIVQTEARPQKRKIRNTNSADDWNNPCGGYYDGSQPSTKVDKADALNFLRKATRGSISNLRETKQKINIDDIAVWAKHKSNYKFLPKLAKNSSIALRRWYRNLQTQVAGLSYLYFKQLAYDRIHNEGSVSNELKVLLHEARHVLCEIESTINRTSINGKNIFSPVSKIKMDKRLKFVTKKIHMDNTVSNPQAVYEIDLKYMKYNFLNYLDTMCSILRRYKPNHILSNSSNQSVNDSNSSRSSELTTLRSRLAGRKHNINNNRRNNQKNKSKRNQKNNESTA